MSNIVMPGCCAKKPPPQPVQLCQIRVAVILQDIMGRTGRAARICGAFRLNYTLTDSNGVVRAAGKGALTYNSSSDYAFSLWFQGLPAGNYVLRVFSDPDACTTDELRFDASRQLGTTCSGTPATDTITVPARYDIVGASSSWFIDGCHPPAGLTVSIAPSIGGGATVCGAIGQSSGPGPASVSFTLKVTSYPVVCTFAASADNCFGETETLTISDCGVSSSDWCGVRPRVMFKVWPIMAKGCGGLPLPNATVTASGYITGTDRTGDDGLGTMTLSAWKSPKCTGNGDTFYTGDVGITWTVTHPRFKGRSYSNTGPNAVTSATDQNAQSYLNDGHYCPMGGSAGEAADGFACQVQYYGCPQPLPLTLHATVLGSPVTLNYQGGDPRKALTGTWVGQATIQAAAESCIDYQGNYHGSDGPVRLYVSYYGVVAVVYNCSTGSISHCLTNESSSRTYACTFVGGPPAVTCEPFLVQGSLTANVAYRDGPNVINYELGGDYTVTE